MARSSTLTASKSISPSGFSNGSRDSRSNAWKWHLGPRKKTELRPNGRNCAVNAVVRADLNRVAPRPEVLAIGHRNAPDKVLFLLRVVIVQIESAIPDRRACVPFGNGSLPEDLRAFLRLGSIQSGFRRNIVTVGTTELGPIAPENRH
jgi:hypothetical protein